MQGSFHTRWFLRRDLPTLCAIEYASHDDPWGEDDFLAALRDRNTIGIVAEPQDRILGFAVYRLHRHSIELLNLAVHPDFRRAGVGSSLLAKLKLKAADHGREALVLYARDRDTAAHLFFRAQGLRAASVLRRWYPEGGDAYLFRWDAVVPVATPVGVRIAE